MREIQVLNGCRDELSVINKDLLTISHNLLAVNEFDKIEIVSKCMADLQKLRELLLERITTLENL